MAELSRDDLFRVAFEIKTLPDSFFDSYEAMMNTFTEEQKQMVRAVLEPEARRRGLRPSERYGDAEQRVR